VIPLKITSHWRCPLILHPINGPRLILTGQRLLAIPRYPPTGPISIPPIPVYAPLGLLRICIILLHLHLRLCFSTPKFRTRVFGVYSGMEVNEEREDVKCEDKGDYPLQARGNVCDLLEVESGEKNREGDFDEDEDEFGIEGVPKNTVLTEVYS